MTINHPNDPTLDTGVSINLRIPRDLHAALKAIAQHQKRSLRMQILHALEAAVAVELEKAK